MLQRTRRNKKAAERRAQYARADGRAMQAVMRSLQADGSHRGKALSKLGNALLSAVSCAGGEVGEDGWTCNSCGYWHWYATRVCPWCVTQQESASAVPVAVPEPAQDTAPVGHVVDEESSRHSQRRRDSHQYQGREGGARGQAPRRPSASHKRNGGCEGVSRGNAPNRPRTPQPTHEQSASPRRASLCRSESKSFRAEPVGVADDARSEASSTSQRSHPRRSPSKSRSAKLENHAKKRRSASAPGGHAKKHTVKLRSVSRSKSPCLAPRKRLVLTPRFPPACWGTQRRWSIDSMLVDAEKAREQARVIRESPAYLLRYSSVPGVRSKYRTNAKRVMALVKHAALPVRREYLRRVSQAVRPGASMLNHKRSLCLEGPRYEG